MNHIELSVELMSILRALNYSCELKTIEGKSIVMDIAVQGELSVRHQKMIEMLLGGFLSEFYWVNGMITKFLFFSLLTVENTLNS